MFDSSTIIAIIPTILHNSSSRLFIFCIVCLYCLASQGSKRELTWNWQFVRAIAKYELQPLTHGLYIVSNTPKWHKITPQLTKLLDSTHQIAKMQILVSRVRNGTVYKGKENISGNRHIIRIDQSSGLFATIYGHNTFEKRTVVPDRKKKVLSFSPHKQHVIIVQSNDKKRIHDAIKRDIVPYKPYTVLMIIDTY